MLSRSTRSRQRYSSQHAAPGLEGLAAGDLGSRTREGKPPDAATVREALEVVGVGNVTDEQDERYRSGIQESTDEQVTERAFEEGITADEARQRIAAE